MFRKGNGGDKGGSKEWGMLRHRGWKGTGRGRREGGRKRGGKEGR